MGLDGSLGVYGGYGPSERSTKLWSAGTGSKGGTKSSYELVYRGDKVILNKDGKVGGRQRAGVLFFAALADRDFGDHE